MKANPWIMKNKIITLFLAVILLVVSVWSVSAQNQDDLLFRRRVVSSGVNSLFYGLALVAIIEPESEAAAAGVPIVAAGLGALVPVLINESRPITVNQLTLTTHGQLVGWAHGFGLSALVLGDGLFDDTDGEESGIGTDAKIAIGLGALTSIGMGMPVSHSARVSRGVKDRLPCLPTGAVSCLSPHFLLPSR